MLQFSSDHRLMSVNGLQALHSVVMICMINAYLVTIPERLLTEHACLFDICSVLYAWVYGPGVWGLDAALLCLFHGEPRGALCTVCVFAGLLLFA